MGTLRASLLANFIWALYGLEEFDPPEMQTAPLEKLYVNVKHLSAKLPEYQITPTEKRKRTPKECACKANRPAIGPPAIGQP